jgi:hypothetical protein
MIDKKKGKLVCDETRAAKGKKIVGGRTLVLCYQRLPSRVVESGRVHGSDVAVLAADVSNRWMTWVGESGI